MQLTQKVCCAMLYVVSLCVCVYILILPVFAVYLVHSNRQYRTELLSTHMSFYYDAIVCDCVHLVTEYIYMCVSVCVYFGPESK